MKSIPLFAEALGPGGRRGLWLLGILTLLGDAAKLATFAALLHLLRG